MIADLKILTKVGVPLLITIIVFFLVLKFGIAKASEVRAKVSETEQMQTILDQKLNLLQEVEGNVLSSSNNALLALPAENPSLAVISQLKKLSSENVIFLSSIKTSGEIADKNGLKRVDVSFDLEGPRAQVIDFLQRIERLAPITSVDKVKLNESGGIARGSIVVKSFWSDLPEKLPAVGERIADLTADEEQAISQISQFIKPVFIEVPPSTSAGREDPFN